MLEKERAALAAAARRLAGERLVLGTAGNLSARVENRIAVTPTGAELATVAADELPVVDLEGRHVHGELAPTSELHLHLGIYRHFDAGAVIHTHAPMATALACVLDEVPVVHYAMLALGGSVRVAPYATFGSDELAAHVLAALEDRSAALMANHGAVVFADDVEAAVEKSLVLEWACTVYWRAAALGRPRVLDAAQLHDVARTIDETQYGTTRTSTASMTDTEL